MNLAEYFHPERIVTGVRAANKSQVLELLAKLLVKGDSTLDAAQVLNGLIIRELLGGTALGAGIAIPHSRIANAPRIVGAFLQLAHGIDFDAADRKKVDLFFALTVPENNADNLHLTIIAHLAKLFSDPKTCALLRNTRDPATLFQIITSWQSP